MAFLLRLTVRGPDGSEGQPYLCAWQQPQSKVLRWHIQRCQEAVGYKEKKHWKFYDFWREQKPRFSEYITSRELEPTTEVGDGEMMALAKGSRDMIANDNVEEAAWVSTRGLLYLLSWWLEFRRGQEARRAVEEAAESFFVKTIAQSVADDFLKLPATPQELQLCDINVQRGICACMRVFVRHFSATTHGDAQLRVWQKLNELQRISQCRCAIAYAQRISTGFAQDTC